MATHKHHGGIAPSIHWACSSRLSHGAMAGGASPSPTVYDVICAFKSLTSRMCKKQYGIEKIFQRSFFDHIIRDKQDYDARVKYIYENPECRYYDDLYSED